MTLIPIWLKLRRNDRNSLPNLEGLKDQANMLMVITSKTREEKLSRPRKVSKKRLKESLSI